jgi:hypothetical protein
MEVRSEAIIPTGLDDDFDVKHTDAVTGYYFPERKEFLYFYMGYPTKAQRRQISPFGSAQAVATQTLGEKVTTKQGVILEPCSKPAIGLRVGLVGCSSCVAPTTAGSPS